MNTAGVGVELGQIYSSNAALTTLTVLHDLQNQTLTIERSDQISPPYRRRIMQRERGPARTPVEIGWKRLASLIAFWRLGQRAKGFFKVRLPV
jgi:hypothetical protein